MTTLVFDVFGQHTLADAIHGFRSNTLDITSLIIQLQKKYMPGGGMLVKKICQGSSGEQKYARGEVVCW